MITLQNYAVYANNLKTFSHSEKNTIEQKNKNQGLKNSVNMLDYLSNSPAAISFKAQNLPIEKNEIDVDEETDSLSQFDDDETEFSLWEQIQNGIKEGEKKDELRKLYGIPSLFSDSEFDCDFDNVIFYDFVEEKEYEEAYNKVANNNIKDLIAKLYNKCVLQNVDLMFLVEIDRLIADISDEKIQNYVNKALKDVCNNVVNDSYVYRSEELWGCDNSEYAKILSSDLEPILNVIDAYNVVTNKYVQYKKLSLIDGNSLEYEVVDTQEFLNEFKVKYPDLYEQLKSSIGDKSNSYWLADEFENAQKIETFLNVKDVELRKYLYSTMIKNMRLTDEEVEKLDEIYSKYNVMVFPTSMDNNLSVLDKIEQELECWKKASNGTANLPYVINLNLINKDFLGKTIGEADIIGNIINLDFRAGRVATILRHELMHINDNRPNLDECTDLLNNIFPTKIIDGEKIIDFENCKYVHEFLKAGLRLNIIKYGYTNRSELLAVAATGNTSKYSPEFKEVLVKLGMPEYVFNLEITDSEIEYYSNLIAKISSNYSDENFDSDVEDLDDEEIDDLENEELD